MINKRIEAFIKASLIISLVVLILFFINRPYALNVPIATDIFGHYGDFIGGVLGTLLSVFLLYLTFKSQIEDSRRNSIVYINQRFNEIFFHLLDQYNVILNGLEVINTLNDDEKLKGKEALRYLLIQMQNDYSTGGINKGRKTATDFFLNLYANNRDFAPIYYRTIYRIFDLITSPDISRIERVKYAKIFRSQLTDSELILLRYNAMTGIGRKMGNFIVEFNLLKHMPLLSLLEYDVWRNRLTASSQNKINSILYQTRKNIRRLDNSNLALAISSTDACYHVNVSRVNQGRKIQLHFNRSLNKRVSKYDDFYGFETLSIQMIRDLFEAFIREVFIFSYFSVKDKRPMINYQLSDIENNGSKESFLISISSKRNEAIILN